MTTTGGGSKAARFGELYRQPTGWLLGWLVASSVSLDTGNGGRQETATSGRLEVATSGHLPKVSARRFAELAEVSRSTINYYARAWELAADDGLVPHAVDIPNVDTWDDLLVDYALNEYDSDDNPPEQHWSHYYQLARKGKQTKAQLEEWAKKKVEEANAAAPSKPEAEQHKPKPKEKPKTQATDEDTELIEYLSNAQTYVSKVKSIGIKQDSPAVTVLRELAEEIAELLKGIS